MVGQPFAGVNHYIKVAPYPNGWVPLVGVNHYRRWLVLFTKIQERLTIPYGHRPNMCINGAIFTIKNRMKEHHRLQKSSTKGTTWGYASLGDVSCFDGQDIFICLNHFIVVAQIVRKIEELDNRYGYRQNLQENKWCFKMQQAYKIYMSTCHWRALQFVNHTRDIS